MSSATSFSSSWRLLAVSLLLAACGGGASETPSATPTPTPTPTTTSAPEVTVTPLFCTYGGVGLVPDPLPPGYETLFATVVLQVDNAGPPIGPVTVGSGSLVDAHGAPVARLMRVDHFVVLPGIEPEGETMGSFAVHLNPEGTPFDGTLPSGRTILRARFSVDGGSMDVSGCRIELAGGPAPLVAERALDGVLPSS